MKTYTKKEVFYLIQTLLDDNFKELETTKENVDFKLGIINVNQRIINLQKKLI